MENECEALPGVAYPEVRDNRSTINTKTGYDDMIMSNNKRSSRDPSIMNISISKQFVSIRQMSCVPVCYHGNW